MLAQKTSKIRQKFEINLQFNCSIKLLFFIQGNIKFQIQGSVYSEYAASPGEMIISSVDRFHGNHIVMGSRGLGIIRRSILGSVSHYVLDHTSVPVTIIPKGTKIGSKPL